MTTSVAKEMKLGETGTAIVRCFPPRGYGYRLDFQIKYEVKAITSDPSPALTELREAQLITRSYVPRNCGPGWYCYRLTAKGRRLRQSLDAEASE